MFFVFRRAFDIQILLRRINTSPIVGIMGESGSVPFRFKASEQKNLWCRIKHRFIQAGQSMKAPRALEWESPILSPSLDRLIATFPLPVIIHDDQDRILQMSAGWTHFSGYTLADVHTL